MVAAQKKNFSLRNSVILFTLLALVAHIALTPKLWFGPGRTFPEVPFFPDFSLPPFADTLLTIIMLTSVPAMMMKHQGFALMAFPVFGISLLLLTIDDVNRLQVWMYFDLLLLGGIAYIKEEKQVKTFLLLMLGIVYAWSAIHKMQIYFFTEIVPWLLTPFGYTPEDFNLQAQNFSELTPSQNIGFVFIIGEILLVLSICWHRTRKIGLYAGILMHLVLLYILGPLGNNYNSSVWPWNVQCLIFLILLIRTENKIWVSLASLKKSLLTVVVVIILKVVPLLNMFGLTSNTMAFHLYSGQGNEGFIHVTELPTVADEELVLKSMIGQGDFSISLWCLYDMNVIFLDSKSNYRYVFNKLYSEGDLDEQSQLRIESTKAYRPRENEIYYYGN